MEENRHTASENVYILDDAFFIPQLNRYRRIWVYLPTGYVQSSKKYPVIYMHDGQNLFDQATSYSGEWEVDETLDATANACIIIGIDNGSTDRMREYNPNDTELHGKGEGLLYLEFIVKTLKPLIDTKFRTMRSKKNTMTAGSSMGGLISLYAGILYPAVFGRIGILSPAFWIVPDLADQIKKAIRKRKHSRQRYYFYGGGAENPFMVRDLLQVAGLMREKAGASVEVNIDPAGEHNEASWRKQFPVFFEWIMK